ncbi:MAG: VWA domain-containing protein [Candidatus Electrothrix sp. GW3-4]|uniref:vWA domain-containing protein n=1 Tax=Candidatus Electrothrix sp. GW3-4 TaxID=3126740 RepID=UPI0030CC69AE
MNIKKATPVILLLTLIACSSEPPQKKSPKKDIVRQETSVDLDTTEDEAIGIHDESTLSPQDNRPREKARLQEMRTSASNGKGLNRFSSAALPSPPSPSITSQPTPKWNTESYNAQNENGFINTTNDPLSTFSIDVDTASYSNVRRFINEGRIPPKGAVRIEELINYFSYTYPQPDNEHPFSVTPELGPCPWNDSHKLVRIGLKAKDMDKKDLPPSNLVFLIDVSGSMSSPNKLPLLQKSMKMLVKQLGKNDRIALVVYAGHDQVMLPPTPGSEQQKITAAIDALGAGGSTHASSGILTAYQLAAQSFLPNGNNRIILASDGDFNVGITSRGELQKLVEEKRKSGVYLTVLGFGMGNYHDDTMEILADKGNGNYAYIDNLLEAKKVMVKEMSGTLFALAKDVKIQVEFNPAQVDAYRLIGYENRALADEDFNDDQKDAGEIGVGHTVTALYELIPVGATGQPTVDPLKYQKTKQTSESQYADELMTIKLRYKPLQATESVLLSRVVKDNDITLEETSNDFRFAAAVAGFGMLLSDSKHADGISWPQILTQAKGAKDKDEEGYRAEFIRLVEAIELLVAQ